MNDCRWAAAAVLAVAFGLAGSRASVRAAVHTPAFDQARDLELAARQRPFTNAEIGQLVSLSHDREWEVRVRALTALRHVANPEQKSQAVKAMREALTDPQKVVRVYAITGLGSLGDLGVIPVLEPYARDPDSVVRIEADRSMGKLYLRGGETHQAISAAEAALHVSDVDPAFLIPPTRDLVAACQKAGKPEAAVSFVQGLLVHDPTNHSYMEMLAIAYEGAGQPDKAAEWHRKAHAFVTSPSRG